MGAGCGFNSAGLLCRYLDYIEEKKDIGMIIRLYERCLVACASYPGNLLFLTSVCRSLQI